MHDREYQLYFKQKMRILTVSKKAINLRHTKKTLNLKHTIKYL